MTLGEKIMNTAEFERVLEEYDLTCVVEGTDGRTLPHLTADDFVCIDLYGSDGALVFSDAVRAEDVWGTFDYLRVLLEGGLL